MFALAESADEARAIIVEKAKADGYDRHLGEIEIELKAEPKIYEHKVGFFVFGGN